ncbi:uncharacterized protein V2V93DRAFT_372856 [Kockiozyma suomiensis]|uniref:uncharacterized protein n=1 Tax=Kockiozyma suomiensis TaxID=1337062 RepID=UPI0033442C6E
MVSWTRLIRFKTEENGTIYFGEPIILADSDDVSELYEAGALKAKLIEPGPSGDIFADSCIVTDTVLPVIKLLGPLTPSLVPTVRCIGLNYLKHIIEAGRKPPPFPSLFIKPSHAIDDYGAETPIPKCAQDQQSDYEGELVVVLGKTGKDIPIEKALDYVAGYTCGNDLSARKWQRDPAFAGVVPQWSFSKGFDKSAPLGPCIVAKELIGDGSGLELKTIVNGELRQHSNTSDFLFKVPRMIEFLSQGTTLEKGSVIMTGTPGGVGFAQGKYLLPGDKIEIYFQKIGTLKHSIVYE